MATDTIIAAIPGSNDLEQVQVTDGEFQGHHPDTLTRAWWAFTESTRLYWYTRASAHRRRAFKRLDRFAAVWQATEAHR